MVPEFEEVGAHKRQGAGGMFLDYLKVLFCHLPNWGAATLKQGWIMQVTLCEEHIKIRRGGGSSDDE